MLRSTLAALLVALLVPLTGNGQDIIISEIMYSPAGTDADREYIEVYNAGSSTVNLNGWYIVDEDPSLADPRDDDINSDVLVPSGEFALLCKNDDTSVNGGLDCDYDYLNDISHENSSDYVVLENASRAEVDRVRYNEDSGWPNANDASLEFTGGVTADNNDNANWKAATVRTGDYADNSGTNKGSPNANAPDGQLPVELAAFDVTSNVSRVQLTWRTTSETNNAGFAIQHQPPSASRWQNVGFVSGEGTTTQPQSYRFTTDRLSAGTHTFRLKQVDRDGTEHVSEPERISVQGEAGLKLVSTHPVAKGQSAVLAVQVDTRQLVTVALYDALGQRVRTVATTRVGPVQPTRATVPTTGLASGIYFLRANGSSFQRTKKLTVVR